MNEKFEELKCKLEFIRHENPVQLYFQAVEAYEKGEIDCREYMILYDMFKALTRDFAC